MDSVQIIQNKSFSDERGEFVKAFDKVDLDEFDIQQGNLVRNFKKATFRGLHMQKSPFSEQKKFNLIQGSIQLVWIDLRPNSISYGESDSAILDDPNSSIIVPVGYATGYLVLEDDSEILYFSDQSYLPEEEIGLRWDNPLIAVNWEIIPAHLSEKDQFWPNFFI